MVKYNLGTCLLSTLHQTVKYEPSKIYPIKSLAFEVFTALLIIFKKLLGNE